MAIRIEVTPHPIIETAASQLDPSEVGAVLEYRDLVRSRIGTSLYDGVDPTKLRTGLEFVSAKVVEEFDLPNIEIVLRMGAVAIGETRTFVRISAAHTNEAFRSMLELLDNLKRLNKNLEALEAQE